MDQNNLNSKIHFEKLEEKIQSDFYTQKVLQIKLTDYFNM